MKNRTIFALSFIGILAGIGAAIVFGITKEPLPPAFSPAASPYSNSIYAEGIVESAQTSGENISVYPEVAGTVKEILVSRDSGSNRATHCSASTIPSRERRRTSYRLRRTLLRHSWRS